MHVTVFLIIFLCSLHVCESYYNDDFTFLRDEDVSHIDDHIEDDALNVFENVQKKSFQSYKRLVCRRWNHHCVPWTNRPGFKCCNGLSCKCNLWMQNCRCVSRLWGR
ncbi:uncharacterized protein LOC123552512 isoform X2 [Mercenaria mercenaria]|uniref:uncharacterized protein LOC123552512 isoform X2 n=1 Tax=Mercenaria mercenaria TaxID=6596 RepID=UPI00234E5F2E|nr:uncharacterized protein LOC123552512 isoform X2 [Mercenaria mercenaria]